jgi:hypothetical protein
MRLFHFSDDPAIGRFTPRPVQVPAVRAPGREWLNGPLVWAISEWRQPMYLFPRDCPRILIWPTENTMPQDRAAWWGDGSQRMIAHVERAWGDRLQAARIYRYELPCEPFEDLQDAGMWVSREAVEPIGLEVLDDLPAALASLGVELRLVDSLVPLKPLVATTLHFSGIRLRNAAGWAS